MCGRFNIDPTPTKMRAILDEATDPWGIKAASLAHQNRRHLSGRRRARTGAGNGRDGSPGYVMGFSTLGRTGRRLQRPR